MKAISLVLAGLLSFAACSPGGAEIHGDPAPPTPDGVLLSFTRSGGFAGVNDTLEVRSDGRAVTGGDRGNSGSFRVPDDLLDELRDELGGLDWERAADEPANVVCADCFLYEIESGGEHVTTTGLGQSGRELRDLLALVDEIIVASDRR